MARAPIPLNGLGEYSGLAIRQTVDEHSSAMDEVESWRGLLTAAAVTVKSSGADDTAALQAAITAAQAAGSKLVFAPGTYRHNLPLTFTGIDVDGNGATLLYEGASGSFAVTFNSTAGGGTFQQRGKVLRNLTIAQANFTAPTTVSGSATYDPPSIAGGAALTGISVGGVSTTVAAPGARAGGYARATFSSIQDGITATAWVSADDVVTVWFSNYSGATVDMASGTLEVAVVNSAYHGLCLGGGLGRVESVKLRGFTGVSFGMGAGRCQVSGVLFPALEECYYWDCDIHLNPASGWGGIVQPRNNVNVFSVTAFAANHYNESAGARRAPCINQWVMSGITNSFRYASLECNSSEESLILTPQANLIEGLVYWEINGSWLGGTSAAIWAQPLSTACDLRLRTGDQRLSLIRDQGTANRIRRPPGYYINGGFNAPPVHGRSLIENGDFENGLNKWSNFSTGATVTLGAAGTGRLSGRSVRVDVVAGRPQLLQALETVGRFSLAGLVGQNVVASAWVRTNLAGVVVRLAGVSSPSPEVDEAWRQIMVPSRITSASSLQVQIITTGSGLTGYVELSNFTMFVGNEPGFLGERTVLEGSATYNPASVAAGAWGASTTITVSGAELGDVVAGVSHSAGGALVWLGHVSAVDTVTAAPFNPTAGAIDLASGALRARVLKV